MPHYHITSANQNQLRIQYRLSVEQDYQLKLVMPSWRPGRYELQNFADRVSEIICKNEKGEALPAHKKDKNTWVINTQKSQTITVDYLYQTGELDAGNNCFSDNDFFSFQPNTCLIFHKRSQDLPITLSFEIPRDFTYKTTLLELPGNIFKADNIADLFDKPFIASRVFENHQFSVDRYRFSVNLFGKHPLDSAQLYDQIEKIVHTQITLFKSFPTDCYHFHLIFSPDSIGHGVEHQDNTVIAFGPLDTFEKPEQYTLFLSFISHELFHAWNAKAVRPRELLKYDFTKETPFPTCYIVEGVTSYFGEKLLVDAGIVAENEQYEQLDFARYITSFKERGKDYKVSLRDSSIDLWFGFRNPNKPFNATSNTYVKGLLVSWLLDLEIRQSTCRKLQDLLANFYTTFKKTGYTELDLKHFLEKETGMNLQDFYEQYIWGLVDPVDKISTHLTAQGYTLVRQEIQTEESMSETDKKYVWKITKKI